MRGQALQWSVSQQTRPTIPPRRAGCGEQLAVVRPSPPRRLCYGPFAFARILPFIGGKGKGGWKGTGGMLVFRKQFLAVLTRPVCGIMERGAWYKLLCNSRMAALGCEYQPAKRANH